MNSAKLQEYKTNTQKSVAFLYTNNEATEREIKESIPFPIAQKPIKYLGINLTKEMKDLKSDYKTLMKKIEDDTKRKTFYGHGLEKQILLKCRYYPKQSTY